jgi:hypothetical protein
VRALGDDDRILAHAAAAHPLADEPILQAIAVEKRGINQIAVRLEEGIEYHGGG